VGRCPRRACEPRFACEPRLSRSTGRTTPEEDTEPPHSLVRRIFMAPFLLLPPGFDILHAHLTLRTAHRRRNWQIKCGLLSPAKRTRDGDGVHCSPAPRTHIRGTYENACERSLVERTIDLKPAGRFSEQICTRSREASTLHNVILTALHRRRESMIGRRVRCTFRESEIKQRRRREKEII